MHRRTFFYSTIFVGILIILLLPEFNPSVISVIRAMIPFGKPDWFGVALEDAQTGQVFKINDFAGKVVLVQTIAEWCSYCAYQQNEVRDAAKLLGNPDDLVVVTLDVDLHEDKASLKKYADYFDFGSRMALSPLEVSRALGNLYSAEYLNPPLEPMLFIDRGGSVYGLPYGMKTAEQLKATLAPYLQQ